MKLHFMVYNASLCFFTEDWVAEKYEEWKSCGPWLQPCIQSCQAKWRFQSFWSWKVESFWSSKIESSWSWRIESFWNWKIESFWSWQVESFWQARYFQHFKCLEMLYMIQISFFIVAFFGLGSYSCFSTWDWLPCSLAFQLHPCNPMALPLWCWKQLISWSSASWHGLGATCTMPPCLKASSLGNLAECRWHSHSCFLYTWCSLAILGIGCLVSWLQVVRLGLKALPWPWQQQAF